MPPTTIRPGPNAEQASRPAPPFPVRDGRNPLARASGGFLGRAAAPPFGARPSSAVERPRGPPVLRAAAPSTRCLCSLAQGRRGPARGPWLPLASASNARREARLEVYGGHRRLHSRSPMTRDGAQNGRAGARLTEGTGCSWG
jgi:hypothetical protein